MFVSRRASVLTGPFYVSAEKTNQLSAAGSIDSAHAYYSSEDRLASCRHGLVLLKVSV